MYKLREAIIIITLLSFVHSQTHSFTLSHYAEPEADTVADVTSRSYLLLAAKISTPTNHLFFCGLGQRTINVTVFQAQQFQSCQKSGTVDFIRISQVTSVTITTMHKCRTKQVPI